MKIGIFTGGNSVRSKNIFTAISRYPTGKHEIKQNICHGHKCTFLNQEFIESLFFETVQVKEAVGN